MNEGTMQKAPTNKEMADALRHVSDTCVGAYGYLQDTINWLERNASWKYLYEGTYECTCCGKRMLVAEDHHYKPKYRYCPYCGASMSGV